jgi:hypothetical protein
LYERKEIMLFRTSFPNRQEKHMKYIATMAHAQLWKAALAATLYAAAFSQPGLAQVPPASVLRIDMVNAVLYSQDTGDVSKFGTDPNVTTYVPLIKEFGRVILIADIQAVNGQRVMGTHTASGPIGAALRTDPAPGQAIADVVRNGPILISFEILKSDGTPIGTIMASGFTAGPPPPGAPLALTGSNFAITGLLPERQALVVSSP